MIITIYTTNYLISAQRFGGGGVISMYLGCLNIIFHLTILNSVSYGTESLFSLVYFMYFTGWMVRGQWEARRRMRLPKWHEMGWRWLKMWKLVIRNYIIDLLIITVTKNILTKVVTFAHSLMGHYFSHIYLLEG